MSVAAKLKSPLNVTIKNCDAHLALVDIVGREAISEPFEYILTVVADDGFPVEKFMAKPVDFSIMEDSTGHSRTFNGIITAAKLLTNFARKKSSYQLCVKPQTDLMDHAFDSRHFLKKSVIDITKEVLQKFPLVKVNYDDVTASNYAPLDFTAQYNETPWHFLQRLWLRDGIYYYFKQEKGFHTLVLIDNLLKLEPFGGELIYETEGRPENHCNLVNLRETADMFGDSAFVSTCFEPRLFAAQSIVLETCQKNHLMVSELTFNAVDNSNLQTPAEDDDHAFHYESEFRAVPASQKIRMKNQVKSLRQNKIAGFQSTLIVGEKGAHEKESKQEMQSESSVKSEVFTNERGEVRVQFPWDREHKQETESSFWMQHTNPIAGSNWGQFWLPRIGNEAPVMYFEGNHDQPQVSGGLYHEKQLPPFNPKATPQLNGIKTKSFDKEKSQNNFHELSFDDTADAEKIHIESANRFEKQVGGQQQEIIGKNAAITIKQAFNTEVTAGSNSIQAAKKLVLKVGSTHVTIEGSKLTIYSGSINIITSGNGDLKPSAEQGNHHMCPMSGPKVSAGPCLTGSSDVFYNGRSAMREGDSIHCSNTGKKDKIKGGAAKVFINGRPMARKGDTTVHGGHIMSGSENVSVED